ncbi:MAG: polyribonucleotide nucleotidyltransferase [Planctomycetota bacterium]|nr:MAG: polyribonucleotide nucleotidyltransferase [Planctomycetota bacterium]
MTTLNLQATRVEIDINGTPLVLETGLMARQAHGAVIATMGETQVFAAVCVGPAREGIDFFPLTVEYREKTEAAGKIPGGFFKREGRPTTKEILTMRLIDRSIRPLFPDGYKDEVQVMCQVLGYDGENGADVLAMIAAFAAMHISQIPFHGAMGAVRVGHVDGRLVTFPTDPQRRDVSRLDLVVAGHMDGICMVEAGARELPENEMIDALELGHATIKKLCGALEELRQKAGKPKLPYTPPVQDPKLVDAVRAFKPKIKDAIFTEGKHARYDAISKVKEQCVAALTQGISDEKELVARTKLAKSLYEDFAGQVEREQILEGRRADGRKTNEIRAISVIPNFIPRHHGSVLFTRGETQALVSCTLGTPDDEQIIDGIEEEYRKSFYLHYNFPPYSVGETRRLGGPGRREIGHGMLAERSLAAVLPSCEQFPYTIRIVSDIMESNGSSSMASVCGGCLAMMTAGVPLTQPVAGIAMGLVTEGERFAVLSDIAGSEDHNGDMDFKVAGSGLGITALQMDLKIRGVSRAVLEAALAQAREGRVHILRKMLEVVKRPSSEISKWAPRYEQLRIPADKIGLLIGPGGRNIKAMQEQYKVKISVVSDDGQIQVYGTEAAKVKACAEAVLAMCETPKIGARYTGTVKGVKEFGAFVEILPGVEGMVHISELAEGYVERVTDVVSIGDKLEVVVINVDDRGKIKLSHKQTLAPR